MENRNAFVEAKVIVQIELTDWSYFVTHTAWSREKIYSSLRFAGNRYMCKIERRLEVFLRLFPWKVGPPDKMRWKHAPYTPISYYFYLINFLILRFANVLLYRQTLHQVISIASRSKLKHTRTDIIIPTGFQKIDTLFQTLCSLKLLYSITLCSSHFHNEKSGFLFLLKY